MAVELGRGDEVRPQLPGRPVARLRVLDLERLAGLGLEHRVEAQREDLPGGAVGDAEDLVLLLRGVQRRQQRADRRGRERVDLGRLRVGRRGAAVARLVVDPAAQPVHAVAAERLHRGARRELQLDRAGAVVEAAGEVLEDDGLLPVVVALGDLPAQRRVLGVHARAAGRRGVDVDLDQQPADRLVEADEQGVADGRRVAERHLVGALRMRLAVGHADVLDLPAALQHVGGRARAGGIVKSSRTWKTIASSRAVRGVPTSVSPPRMMSGSAGGSTRRKRRSVCGGARPVELDAEQLEQRDVELVRHAVEPVDRHLGHPGEQLDQRDAGVRDVVLRPLRAGAVDAQARLGDEVLEAPVVELDVGELAHSAGSSGSPSSGMT